MDKLTTQRHAMDLKECTCIYFLFDDEKLVYIGVTENLRKRIGQHIYKSEIVFNSFSYHQTDTLDHELEADLIFKYKPMFNKSIPPNKKWISLCLIREKYFNRRNGKAQSFLFKNKLEPKQHFTTRHINMSYYDADDLVKAGLTI